MLNQKLLEEIGLTKGEIKVYITLLKLGETTTGKIIEEAQISSGKIYEILEKLSKKGLVSYILKEKTKYFSASSPNRILDFLKEKESELKNQEEELKKEILSLNDIKVNSKTESKLYRGFRGIETAIFEALNSINPKDEVYAMGVVSNKNEKYNILWEKWHRERIVKKIKCKAIFSDKNSDYSKALERIKLIEIKFLEGITPSAIDIMGDNVLIFTYNEEPSCLFIKNSEIAKSFKTFFETLWKVAK